jgi:hypothetical protein
LYVMKTSMSQNETKTDRAYDAARIVRTDCGKPILKGRSWSQPAYVATQVDRSGQSVHATDRKCIDRRAAPARAGTESVRAPGLLKELGGDLSVVDGDPEAECFECKGDGDDDDTACKIATSVRGGKGR